MKKCIERMMKREEIRREGEGRKIEMKKKSMKREDKRGDMKKFGWMTTR